MRRIRVCWEIVEPLESRRPAGREQKRAPIQFGCLQVGNVLCATMRWPPPRLPTYSFSRKDAQLDQIGAESRDVLCLSYEISLRAPRYLRFTSERNGGGKLLELITSKIDNLFECGICDSVRREISMGVSFNGFSEPLLSELVQSISSYHNSNVKPLQRIILHKS